MAPLPAMHSSVQAGPEGPVTSEAERMRAGRLVVGQQPDVVLWRNQAGMEQHGWKEAALAALEHLRQGRTHAAIHALEHPALRTVVSGLCKGASDNIGIVAPHGRFLALEWKSARGRLTKEQSMFIDLVNARGGVARCVRDSGEAMAAVEEARKR